ncbi:MAG: galactokinase [Ruminococcaceae bacterium]|nr:galactokinase [Oscillospiraceae bacterium]
MTPNEIKSEFIKLYGGSEEDIRIFYSPGRVNLIGEHTDYNGGFVFPAALTMGTMIALRVNGESKLRMKATDLPDLVEMDIDNLDNYRDLWWGNYQAGVCVELLKEGYDIVGCDMLYDDTLPHGGGLSSSAAIEVATALAFATLSNEKNGITEPVDMIKMAFIGQAAEHNYCNVNCGIMDQFASAMGKRDHAIFLDCKKMDYQLVPLKMDGCKLVITNTNKKHSLASSKYNERRSECDTGYAILKEALPEITCLGDVTVEMFEGVKHLIKDEIILNRITHVINEDDRVLRSIKSLTDGDIELFGKLMTESHVSLRDLYEVTGDELDTLAAEAWKIPGVLGSRMTGAGFGGSTVSIVKEEAVDEFKEKVGKNYTEKIGYAPTFYVCDIGDGGREIK